MGRALSPRRSSRKHGERVETCEACRGYLKSITRLRATPPEALVLVDLDTVELDILALEHGYTRRERPGYRLGAKVIEASSCPPATVCRASLPVTRDGLRTLKVAPRPPGHRPSATGAL
jgi:hypothetical protein